MIQVLVFFYVAMVVVANWTVALWGPSVAVLNAFLLIGPVMTIRDVLHKAWGANVRSRMFVLIGFASLISWALNPASGRIAFGSFLAFAASEAIDYLIYVGLQQHQFLVRSNWSNIGGAIVDSVVFMGVAFGVFIPEVFIGQIVAKIVGGFVYSLMMTRNKVTQ